eukprot:gene20921-27117_t
MSNKKLLKTFIGGNENSKTVIVFISGFPDNERSAFNDVLNNLSSLGTYRLISMCLPDMETNATPKPWGYSPAQVLQAIDDTINHYLPDKSIKINLVIHDWGSFYGLLYENTFPERVNKIVNLDVGLLSNPPIKSLALILLYQLWFAFAYFVSQAINYSLGDLLFKLFVVLCPASFRVTSPDEKLPRPKEEVNVSHCYFYYHFWKELIFNGKKALKPKFPKAKMLFLFGRLKNVMFHDDKFIQKIRDTQGCKYVKVDSGHWIATAKPQLVTDEIIEFIESVY